MNKQTIFLIILCCAFLFIQCSGNKSKLADSDQIVVSDLDVKGGEKEDGIGEAQLMEFERTKDIALGYVPKQRLIEANNYLLLERRAGNASRISALSWNERGPNADVVGPGNGNTRGPSNNAVTSGRMRAILVDLADASNHTVWAASVSGGLWKTTDISASPSNWVLINDFLGNLAVTSICQNPVNTSIMYFGTGEMNGNIGAVRGGGIWKSLDHGVTWNLLLSTTNFWNVSKIACDATGNLYVGTSGSGAGLQRSNDGGNTWVEITPSTPSRGSRITDIKISNTGRMHVTKGFRGSAANQSGYFYTDNPSTVDSVTWTTPVVPFSAQYNCEMAVSGNNLYILPSNASYLTPQIFKSVDGGESWAATLTSPPGTAVEPSINLGQGWYDLAIGVDPNDPNIAIAGGLNFYRTTDGGANWSQLTRWIGISLNYVHADHHIVVWNGSQVLVGTDGGIFYSSDNASSFTDRNVGLRLKQFYSCAIHPVTTNYFLAGSQDNGTHQLLNAGLGSSTEVFGGDGGFVHIDENEPQFQFGSIVYSNYRRSINGGASWSSVSFSSSIGQFINPTDYDDINNRMYTSATAGNYIRWENPQTGNTFNSVSIATATTGNVISIKVSPYTNNLVFFGSSKGRIVKSENAHSIPAVSNITGASMPASTVSSINVGTSDNYLIASYSNYGAAHVWMSTTGGGTAGWTNISGNLPDIPVRWTMFYPEDNDKAIIATDMGIFETNDINGSATIWIQNSTFPSVRTEMLQYRYRDNTLIAATHGRGLWSTVITPAVPYIRFASSYTYSPKNTEATSGTNGCRNYKDFIINMHIDAAPSANAIVTLAVAGAGTAVQGTDFDFSTNGDFTTPSNMLTFASGTSVDQPITIRVYDDAEIENEESFTLNYSVGGSSNAIAAPGSLSYTFSIADNDLAPLPESPGTQTIGTGNYGSYVQPFRGSYAKAKSQYIYTAAELSDAGFIAGSITSLGFNVTSKGSTVPYTAFNISLKNTTTAALNSGIGFETGATLCYSNTYSTVTGVNTFVFNTTPFTWDGISNLLVEICYDNADNTGTADDFVASNSTTDQKGFWARVNNGVAGCSITSGLFDGVGSPITYVRPNIILNALLGKNSIETALNKNRTLTVSGNNTYYFFSPLTNKIINSISAASENLGCVTSTLFEEGNTWQSFYAGPRSQKVVDVAFTANNNATYNLGLYYTAAELAGKTAGTLNIAATTASGMAAADISNSKVYATTVVPYGLGYLFTATVTGNAKFFLTEGNVTSLFQLNSRRENFVQLLQNPVNNALALNMNNPTRKDVSVKLFTNTGQLIKTWNAGKADGIVLLPFSGTWVANGVYIIRVDAGNKTQSLKLIKQ